MEGTSALGMQANPVRWGLLAASGIAGRALAPALAQSTHATACAVASRDAAKARAFADAAGIEHAYGSYEDLLADDSIEVVYVSLPNNTHIDWTIRALEAGKHVLCEKPMDSDPARVAQAYDAAEKAGRYLMEAIMYRHHPDTAKIVACVNSGDLGEIHSVRSALCRSMPAGSDFRMAPELDGGALMDVGCYALSGLRLVAGEPERVSGVAVNGPTGVDLRFTGFLKYAGGLTASFNCGLDLPSRSVIEVVGTKGMLRADWPFFRPFFPHVDPARLTMRIGLKDHDFELTEANPYVAQVDNLSMAVRGQTTPLLGRADAMGQARVIAALRQSAARGSDWVDIAQ